MDINSILDTLPAAWALPASLLIIACNLVTVFVRPPAAGSRWVLPYRLVSTIALNIGWAANHIKPGQTRQN
ncbi:hypothetical protein NQF87_08365 [Bombella sp. TMW 2.2559]|uniref:Uncharacterized protein n=1 Tax=Bombella dulcis TaxID=2967339 RepID=A0ABT3WGS1_9PROT|nr:hypothetical protein [Bombella dulcis]MCX5616979.1 hypothetical protein [Bombella dulcis]